MSPYSNSKEHLLAELERLDLLIRVQVWHARQLHAQDNEITPYYISEGEVDRLLAQAVGQPIWTDIPLPPDAFETIQASLDEMAQTSAERCRLSSAQDLSLRLPALAERFQLSQFDLDVILICLAPELDQRYLRLFGYLHDDMNQKLPTVDLACTLLCPNIESKMSAQERFHPAAPLVRHSLLHLLPNPSYHHAPLIAKSIVLDDSIRRFLLEDDTLDPFISRFVDFNHQPEPAAVFYAASAFKERLYQLGRQLPNQIMLFQGTDETAKLAISADLAHFLHLPILHLDGKRLLHLEPAELLQTWQYINRETRLRQALLYWAHFAQIKKEIQLSIWDQIWSDLGQRPGISILSTDHSWEPANDTLSIPITPISLSPVTRNGRLARWQYFLNGQAKEEDLILLASQFQLDSGQIKNAVASARNMARWQRPGAKTLSRAELMAASRQQSNQKLSSLAQKIPPHYTWEDIVLPDDQKGLLEQLFNQVRHQAQVLETWGFGQKFSLSQGVNALFSGLPGTGKTMAADVLATELGLDLFKIDLSMVVSKYIGETEKNLSRIFSEAETSQAILFFDEADALFGKRTEIKDAHDRYANIETSYLLQRIEAYAGVVILATNLRQNMDKAFVRRMHFIIEFPMPTADERYQIWTKIWPDLLPLDPTIDFKLLAEQLEISGAHIRNIALSAAFLAAAESPTSRLIMDHIVAATRAEYKKIGKWLDESVLNSRHMQTPEI